MWKSSCTVLLSFLLAVLSARSQHLTVGDPVEDYLRVLQISGETVGPSFTVRPLSAHRSLGLRVGSVQGEFPGPWQRTIAARQDAEADFVHGLFDPVVETFVNSSRPWGQNDGAIWQGKGATSSVSAGAFARYRFVTAALRPRFMYTENREFPLSSIPQHELLRPYGYPGRSDIDLPQRFGSEAFARFYLGQSYVQAEYRGLAAGVSTENLWWGPGIRNAIVLSNNAGGFRHAFLNTVRPIDVGIGRLEGSWIWGSLDHTTYFVDVSYSPNRVERGSEENRRFLTGMILTYEPKWIPGLYVGAAQTYMVHASAPFYLADYVAVLNLPFVDDTGRHDDGTDDKLVSLFARWVLPASGFEVYGEWARGDHTSTFRDLFVAPDHARGFTVGFQKVYRISSQYLTRLGAEHTILESPREVGARDNTQRGQSYFYTHEGIKQGYTHRGQVLGAGIGPGSQGQCIRFDVFGPFGRVGLHALREVFDNDLYYQIRDNHYEHQVSVAGGLSWLVFYKRFEMESALTRIKTFNRDFEVRNDDYNTNVRFSLRYVLGYR